VFLENATKISPERKQKVNESIQTLEGFLASDEWFAGANMTIADLSILAIITQLDCCGLDVSKHPRLSAWYERCKALPCYKEDVAGAKLLGDVFQSRLEEGGGFN
jgi:glutathione S-transferase